MSTLTPLPKRFATEAAGVQWFWANSMIPREVAMMMVIRAGPKFNLKFGSAAFSAGQIVELHALTLACIFQLSVLKEDQAYQKRKRNVLQVAQRMEELSRSGGPIIPVRAATVRDLRAYVYKNAPKKGVPKKYLGDQIAAKLIGFFEFATGKSMWNGGEDPRVSRFLKASIQSIANTLCQCKEPWGVEIGKRLRLPGSIGPVLKAAKARPDDLAFAEKTFWTIATIVHPEKFKRISRELIPTK